MTRLSVPRLAVAYVGFRKPSGEREEEEEVVAVVVGGTRRPERCRGKEEEGSRRKLG